MVTYIGNMIKTGKTLLPVAQFAWNHTQEKYGLWEQDSDRGERQ